jgi:hypothetical protein
MEPFKGSIKPDKGEDSIRSSPIQSFPDPEEPNPIGSQKEEHPALTLETLSKEELELCLRAEEQASLKISRGIAEKTISEGLYKVNAKTILVISGSLFQEDNFIGAMIGSLAQKHDVDVRKVPHQANLTNAYDEKFIIGVWFGLESTDYKNRRRDKVSYELGRTCSWCLRIRDEFRSNPRLGDKALINDNYFFGNNPGEVTAQGQPVTFILKSRLMASIDRSETANAVYGFISYISNLVRLDNVPDEIYWKTIANSLKPFDQMVSKHYNAVYSRKKGKTVLVGYRRPNLPKSSRLLTQGEMNLLINFIKPVFTQLDKIQRIMSRWFMNSVIIP